MFDTWFHLGAHQVFAQMDAMSASSTSKHHAVADKSSDNVAPNNDLNPPNGNGSKDILDTEIGKVSRPTYASLFRDNRVPNDKCALEFVPVEGNELSLSFNEIDTVESSLGWCLVGCMVGRKLNGYAVRELIKRWGKKVRFQIHESGWITFTFESNEDRQIVLKGGPYMLFGRYIFLKEMPRCFLFRVEDMLSLPMWVQIHGLPVDCWTNMALSRIASVVGKPIHTDQLTQSKGKVNFARVLIEVDASQPKTYEFPINLPTGDKIKVRFVYEVDTKFCISCNVLGHSWDVCRNNPNQGNDIDVDNGSTDENMRLVNRGRSRNPRRGRSASAYRGRMRARGRRLGRVPDGRGTDVGRVTNDNVIEEPIMAETVEEVIEEVVPDGEEEGIDKNDDSVSFEISPPDGSDKFVVEVFEGELDNDGFELVTSKQRRRAVRYLKRLEMEGESGSTSSSATAYIELDPKSWLPYRNARTLIMSKTQAEARRLRAAARHS